MKIIKVNKDNYYMFDDMVFYRKHNRYKNADELIQTRDFASCYKTLETQTFYVFAVQIEEHFVGYIFLNYLPKIGPSNEKGWLFIDDLWVNPLYRRKGVAHALMVEADILSKELNTAGLRLYVNTKNSDAIDLYNACGYGQKFGTSMLMQKEW